MLKEWQFNVLFFVGVGGAVLLLIGPAVGLNVSQNATAIAGVGAILSYVLTQKSHLVKSDNKKKPAQEDETEKEASNDGL